MSDSFDCVACVLACCIVGCRLVIRASMDTAGNNDYAGREVMGEGLGRLAMERGDAVSNWILARGRAREQVEWSMEKAKGTVQETPPPPPPVKSGCYKAVYQGEQRWYDLEFVREGRGWSIKGSGRIEKHSMGGSFMATFDIEEGVVAPCGKAYWVESVGEDGDMFYVSSGSFQPGSFNGTLCSSLTPRKQIRFNSFRFESGPTVVLTSDDYAIAHQYDESAPLVELVPAVAARATAAAAAVTPVATATVLPPELQAKMNE